LKQNGARSSIAGETNAAEACKVDVRFIYQVLRGSRKKLCLRKHCSAFEAASADPERIVALIL